MVGSKYYVNSLSSANRAKIGDYLNFDMIGSPDRLLRLRRRPHDREDLQGLLRGRRHRRRAGDRGRRPFGPLPLQERGHSGRRSLQRRRLHQDGRPGRQAGGTSGQAFDRCYHASCDAASNIDDTALNRNADALAYAVWTLSS